MNIACTRGPEPAPGMGGNTPGNPKSDTLYAGIESLAAEAGYLEDLIRKAKGAAGGEKGPASPVDQRPPCLAEILAGGPDLLETVRERFAQARMELTAILF